MNDVLNGMAPVIGYVTVIKANLLAGLAHRELGDQHAATAATESALALAEADRLVLPFAMTGVAGAARTHATAEIARELSVSVNTVNTHIRNIYAKLQAQDRSSAVQRARQMRLLSASPTRR